MRTHQPFFLRTHSFCEFGYPISPNLAPQTPKTKCHFGPISELSYPLALHFPAHWPTQTRKTGELVSPEGTQEGPTFAYPMGRQLADPERVR